MVCAYASILWPGISATMFVMALSIMLRKHVRSLIGTQLPLLMCGGWLLDTAGHIAAAATDSDAYTAGMESNGADVTRALTVSAMAVALMLGAIVPTRLKAGLVSVSAVAFARLLAIAGHHAAVEGGVTWPIAAGVIAGVLGAYATLFLLRPDSGACLDRPRTHGPSTTDQHRIGAAPDGSSRPPHAVIAIMPTQLPGVIWKVARNGRMSVGGSNEDLVQRAMTLKLLAWACMMLTGGLLCLPGERP